MIPNNSRGFDTLRARGLRLTRPRRLILDVVRATDAHPTAAVVYQRVRRRLPRVSLATVHRNLRMLAAEGFLAERADAGGMRFDGNTAPHDHFTCLACGRIYDVPARPSEASGAGLRRASGSRSWSTEPNTTVAAARAAGNAADHQLPNTG